MDTGKLFMNGRSQAVRLPKKYRFEGNEVLIKKTDAGVLLIPKTKSQWEVWKSNLMKYDSPFMEKRNQPEEQQEHKGLNEVFD
jgi:antitoxin VapB